MNKLLLTLLTTAAMVTASAADYQYLTFEMTYGTKASVETTNLSLTFDGWRSESPTRRDNQTRDELIALLSEIKHELYNGKLNLQGPAQGINKNS